MLRNRKQVFLLLYSLHNNNRLVVSSGDTYGEMQSKSWTREHHSTRTKVFLCKHWFLLFSVFFLLCCRTSPPLRRPHFIHSVYSTYFTFFSFSAWHLICRCNCARLPLRKITSACARATATVPYLIRPDEQKLTLHEYGIKLCQRK